MAMQFAFCTELKLCSFKISIQILCMQLFSAVAFEPSCLSTSSAETEYLQEPVQPGKSLDRWGDADVRLLISTWLDNKHLFGVGKAAKKDVFEKIAQQFSAKAGRVASGEQCLRKWGKR